MLRAILIGFGILIPVFSLIKTSNLKTVEVKNLFILTGVQTARIAGLLYFIIWAVDTFNFYSDAISIPGGFEIIKATILGKLWMLYWLPPVFCLMLTQVFWIKKMYIKKSALITFAIFILILPSYLFIRLLSMVDGKDIGDAAQPPISQSAIYYAISIVIFFFITFAIMLMGGKLKDKK
jgi:hypothetical protein